MSLPLDVSPLVPEFNVGPLTVTRQGARVKSASGVYTPGPTTTISVNPVTSHPLEGNDLLQYPEADRIKGMRQFYTHVALSFGPSSSDVVAYGGQRWKVVKSYPAGDIGGVWISHAVRMEDNAP